jgi:hypothetical protein
LLLAAIKSHNFNFTVMKKTLSILAGIIFTVSVTKGQDNATDTRNNLKFGLKLGSNLSNIYDTKGEKFDAKSKFGLAGGVFLAVPIGEFLGIQPELIYSQKGYKQTGAFLGSNYTLNRTTDYIDIPLLVSIKPVNFLTVQLGPQYSYLMKQKDVFSNSTTTIEQQKEFKNDNIRKNTLSLIGGVDINIDKIIIGTRASLDVQNNNGDGTSTNPRYKNAYFQVSIGFSIL